MVYVHGGAFILGSGGKLLYAPDYLIKHDVIVITFNYRLGALGFLCLGTKDAPGNAGLKDQIAALRWVRKNVAAFGGDPDNITIFGQSAGGTSVSLLLASEATTGLYKRAIVQSGSSLSSWALNRQPKWVASLIVKELGHDTNDPEEIYEILSKTSFKDLVRTKPARPLDKYLDTQLLHLPCVEKYIPGVEPAITDLPINLLTNKPKTNVSVMYGTTSKEGLFVISKDDDKTVKERDEKYIFASDLEFPSEKQAEIEDNKVRQFYFGDERMSMKNILNISDMFTHLYFEVPSILESEILMENSNMPVYNYYFNYAGGRNFLKYITGFKHESGACHADELLYIFRGNLWPFPIRNKDQQMINWMTKLWTNFAKNGDPTPPHDSQELPVRWSPSKKEDVKFLHIEDELTMGRTPNPSAYRLWKDLYNKYRKKYVDIY
ncbi:hypothetical protein O3G_MSEX009173 [Manduca sexta]|nr:hypothetical protein O3G_MSEX009173 [Manduca sexta]